MTDFNTILFRALQMDLVAFHIKPKKSCTPTEIRKQFITPVPFPAKLFLSRDGKIEEILDDNSLSMKLDKKHEIVKYHYVIIFENLSKTTDHFLTLFRVSLMEFVSFVHDLQKEKIEADEDLITSTELLSIEFLAISAHYEDPKVIREALEDTTGFKWSLEETDSSGKGDINRNASTVTATAQPNKADLSKDLENYSELEDFLIPKNPNNQSLAPSTDNQNRVNIASNQNPQGNMITYLNHYISSKISSQDNFSPISTKYHLFTISLENKRYNIIDALSTFFVRNSKLHDYQAIDNFVEIWCMIITVIYAIYFLVSVALIFMDFVW